MSDLLGLRGRLAAALVAVSALTLVVTAVLLLLPLDRKLREDARQSLGATARTARPALDALPASALRPGSPRLDRAVRLLRRRSGADAYVFDASGRLLAGTDIDRRDRFPEVAKALRTRLLASRFGRSDGAAQAHVAVPVTIGGRRAALALRRSLRDLNGARDVVRRSLVAAAFVALAVALIAGIALASRLVRRLGALRDSALRVAEMGPGAAVPHDDGRDEIGDLTRAFTTMQDRLAGQEQARRTFVSTASHELRTPLASLRLMLDAADAELDAPQPDLADVHDQVERALRQTVRLGRLSEELLDLSRLDAGVELRAEPVELRELVRSVLAEFEPAGPPRPRLAPAGAAWATADPGALARILRILVDNARRHAGPDGGVEVRVGPGPSLTVADSGPGVPEAERERIFERFVRGPAATHGDGGGFGLGLAIGRELARRMGGELELVAGGPGATFRVGLPPAADGDAD